MLTQAASQVLPAAESATCTSGPSPTFTAGRAAAMAENRPMSACQRPSPSRRSVLRPARVSISSVSLGRPWVYKNSATQRTPLPHISPSLPSALNMRMVASAPGVAGGQMQMMPSAPTEKCRRDSCTDHSATRCGRPEARQSR